MKDRVGEKFITNEGYLVEIIEYFDSKNSTIKFEDGGIVKNVRYTTIKRGRIKNLNHTSVYGVGYIGYGNYKPFYKGVRAISATVWAGMLQRCYNHKYHLKKPSYTNCTVHSDWHNYQNFAKWFDENYIEGFELDKDILIKGNKVYSSETCCFVPQELNTMFTKSDKCRGLLPIGVFNYGERYKAVVRLNGRKTHLGVFNTQIEAFKSYKGEKESQIKKIAEKWKDQISEKCYYSLINYKVEITD